MEIQDKIISLENEMECFNRYFEANSRCILSAPFGEGKSFFLNEFIKKKCDEYDFITLYPTNYQVCDNQDIFEYIKRDILFGLIALDETILDKFDSTKLGIVGKTILSSRKEVTGVIPDINASVFGLGFTISPRKIINSLSKIWESCKKQEDTSGNPFKEYLVAFNDQEGSIYELDPVTNLICSEIQSRQNKGRKVVLIVEDLDRIDPGQIFRVLNVLSAHMTYNNGYDDGRRNKFNLDKILILCDLKNIETIYHHLYGEKTDFKGYISKFTPNNTFHYSLRNKLEQYINSLYDKDLYENHTSICESLTKVILSNCWDRDQLNINLRVIKSHLSNVPNLLTDRKIVVNERFNLHINMRKLAMYKILAIGQLFNINICSFLEESLKQNALIFNDIVKLCWPYALQKRGEHILPYPTADNIQYYRFGYSDDVLWEQKNDEITNICFPHGYIIFPYANDSDEIFKYIQEGSLSI